ncbi:hypothetical protein KQI68_01695 [Peptoniphilus sp. MSJ-1]|uniref:Uncharacterized protein n=1 Tax=Peptoniphilus ovalis TaxID=2841503 RepID=A0ABS6FF19_9FIRM|nr:hypothetical protein [Peptoniphilus ovalis]MBU5668546.1 hypothetical protein [Peptoniphilus ovalis]
MRHIKKYLFITIVSLVLISNVFAAEPVTSSYEDNLSSNNQNLFEMIYNDPNKSEITPYASFYGNAGYTTLDFMESNGSIQWAVKPKTTTSYTFYGYFSVYTNSTGFYRGGYSVIKKGKGTVSDFLGLGRFNLRRGVSYKIRLTGYAEDITGKKYYVNPNVEISFVL